MIMRIKCHSRERLPEAPVLLPRFKSARKDSENHTESVTLSICCSTTGNKCATWFASRNAAVTASGCSPDMRKAYRSKVKSFSNRFPDAHTFKGSATQGKGKGVGGGG